MAAEITGGGESLAFRKMHGLGNDFVVFDARTSPLELSQAELARVADRHFGIGCDQVVILLPPPEGADVAVRFFNADGSKAEACGNATRCVARLLFRETGKDRVVIRSLVGELHARAVGDGLISVDMGPPRLDWQDVPLAREMDTLHLDFALGPLSDPVAVSMGNPHVVFFVEDADAIDLAALGPQIEHAPLFPERTNVQVVQVLPDGALKHRIWERGAGATHASGSSACAVIVAAVRRRLISGRSSLLHQPGGTLRMAWRESDGHVEMTGPAAEVFTGQLDPAILEG
ncbi:diaminopimelate epimerase [Aquibaculum arenosum]|uniref:Diaminopimelate epimerase n=1 Tax=Aquibaculum arenosum TaxID=3032591 RepID=A0ABT5YRF8_9PROT|nr:diaminopimelate epimerase [Fodinicurvata sp. CAU 1616]MDF2096804.1 diaminopimelate epimerase [Fodinicurvata sp. CAU 1616]